MDYSQSGAVWRRTASLSWLEKYRTALDAATGASYAVVERPKHSRVSVEYFCGSSRTAKDLQARFGGTIEPVAADWLERCWRQHLHAPIRVGGRLVVVAEREQSDGDAPEALLVIPAGAAFGTGDHPTTAMSLRLLEQTSRALPLNWHAFDAGTGSGILALAARLFGAGDVLGIDNDPLAIMTAKANSAANKIRRVKFLTSDARKPPGRGKFDLITANLFSELLIVALPQWQRRLRRGGRIILSGILRTQEREVSRALRQLGLEILIVRRRGKWVAILAMRAKRE